MYFRQAKLLRYVDRGALLDVSSDPNTVTLIVVMNLPQPDRRTKRVDINAKLVSTYDYLDGIRNVRKLRLYDLGRPCSREEGPESITLDNTPWANVGSGAKATGGVLAKLPEGHSLKGSGTGRSRSDDGYRLTNCH